MQWEYKVVKRQPVGLFRLEKAEEQKDVEFLAVLNELGAEGWEMVSMIGGSGIMSFREAALKRPLSPQNS